MNAIHDLKNGLAGGMSLSPLILSAGTTGSILDIGPGQGLSTLIANIGAVSGTGTMTAGVLEGDTTASLSLASGSTLTVVGADANTQKMVNFLRTKRYAQVTMGLSGAGTFALSGDVFCGKQMEPAGNVAPGYDRSPST